MKKVYVNEGRISDIINGRLLPQFLFKMVKAHMTSLGDNEAFPTSDGYPFDYMLAKERYNEVCEAIETLNLESTDEDFLMSELSKLVRECKDIEKPIRDSLEKICENALNRLFAIPEETIQFDLKLVDKVKFKKTIRMRPESNEEATYTFKDIADIDLSNKAIAKRRIVDALIQGASYTYSNIEGLYIDDIDKINRELPRLYRRIRIINDYLLFTKKEEMSDDKPMQGSYVETHLGTEGSKTSIRAQGIIFPLLLHEAIKGMFELFSSHGLPKDKKKAEYIIKKADFILAEPWDLRLGVKLWEMIFGQVEDTNMIPYMFTSLVKIPTDEFNITLKEIFSNTERGSEIIQGLMADAEYDQGYQEFTNRVNARNVDKSIINDSFFAASDYNGYELSIDDEDGGVIEENDGDNDNGNDFNDILSNVSIDEIEFIEGEADDIEERVTISVNNAEIPSELVDLRFRMVRKNFPKGKKLLLNLDINIDESLRGRGLGTKIYAKAVYDFGAICSRFSTRHNDESISGIFKKLNSLKGIYAFEDAYSNAEGEPISDYYAILESELGKYA